MTDRGEFTDDRDDEPRDPHAAYGPGWTRSVLSFEDALIDPDLLDHVLPLDGRWPEPRLLGQTHLFFLRDRTRLATRLFDAETAEWLMDELHTDLPDWHAAATFHEGTTTPSTARDVLAALGVPAIRDIDPQTWLESTVLFRWLSTRASAGDPPV